MDGLLMYDVTLRLRLRLLAVRVIIAGISSLLVIQLHLLVIAVLYWEGICHLKWYLCIVYLSQCMVKNLQGITSWQIPVCITFFLSALAGEFGEGFLILMEAKCWFVLGLEYSIHAPSFWRQGDPPLSASWPHSLSSERHWYSFLFSAISILLTCFAGVADLSFTWRTYFLNLPSHKPNWHLTITSYLKSWRPSYYTALELTFLNTACGLYDQIRPIQDHIRPGSTLDLTRIYLDEW